MRRTVIAPIATAVSHQRNAERGPEAQLPGVLASSGNSSTSACRSATWTVRPSTTDRPVAVLRPNGRLNSPITAHRDGAAMGDEAQPIAVQTEDGGIVRFAQVAPHSSATVSKTG